MAKQTFSLKSYFSWRRLFYKSWFSNTNLVFTITLSIYRLVFNLTNTGVFRLKLPRDARKIFLLIPWAKIFASNLLFQGNIEQNYLSNNIKNLSFCGVKKQQFITWYSSLHFILLTMTISSPLKWEISTAEFTLL